MTVALTISAGSITFLTIWNDADTNGDRTLDDGERDAFARRLADGFAVTFDDAPAPIRYIPGSLRIAATLRTFTLESADAAGATVRADFRVPFTGGMPRDITLTTTHYAASPYRRAPDIIPTATAPLGVIVQGGGDVNLRMTVTTGDRDTALPTPAPPTNPNHRTVAIMQRYVRAPGDGPGFVLLGCLVALLFGALHALTPGHGKTMMAAYLIGADGRPRDALALGGIVTLTHTGSVVALGVVTLIVAHVWTPDRILPWLEIVSSVAILGVGGTLVHSRIQAARLPRRRATEGEKGIQRGSQAHHDALHEHEDGTIHAHGWRNGHAHRHHPPQGESKRALLLVGISGGLLPCPDALAILLIALAAGQVITGLLIIGAFSLGLAATLTPSACSSRRRGLLTACRCPAAGRSSAGYRRSLPL